MTTPDSDPLAGLAARIDRVLASLLEPGQRVALVNYPEISNLGDAAIWLGARRALRRRGVRVVHACTPGAYRRRVLERAVGADGTILIQGGGNLGDLYPGGQQRVRALLLRDFPRARLIQLPQSIWFRRPGPARRFARLCASHPDLTLLVRERASLERAADLGLRARLCPDLAFALEAGRRARVPRCEVMWIARRGPERLHAPPAAPPAGVEVGDYPGGREQRAGRAGRVLGAAVAASGLLARAERARIAGPALRRPALEVLDLAARRRLALARRTVATGRALVTDRYHAHVLACMDGIPNVLLDNVYGKNRALFEAGSGSLPGAHWAEDPDGALALALRLAGGAEAGG